jgi:hypothetical protein
MVATDVASRGIGMIDHNSSPLPLPLEYAFISVSLTIDVV